MSTIFCGIDFHKRTSTIYAISHKKEKPIACDTVKTEQLRLYFSNKVGWKIAIEATGGSNHIVEVLKQDGHDITLINPNQFRGIGIGGKKTDERDAKALAQAMMMGFVPRVHHKSISSRQLKSLLTSREIHVRHRSALMSHIRATLREYGITFAAGAEAFYQQVKAKIDLIEFPILQEVLKAQVGQVFDLREIEKSIEENLQELTKEDERIKKLRTIPGVGPLSAYALIAIIDGDVSRFADASQFAAYLGLVPRVTASAEKRMMGAITRSGSEMLRRYLIHGARAWMKYSVQSGDKNRIWAEKVKTRRGQNKAVVALAHRIARIAFAVLRDNSAYRGTSKKKSELAA